MSYALRIEHADGSTSTLQLVSPDSFGGDNRPSVTTLRTTQKIAERPDETATAEAAVLRGAWKDVEPDIDTVNDKFFIEDDSTTIFGGRLRDTEARGPTVSILLDGPKRDAIDAEPSEPNILYPVQDDSSTLSLILNRVPTIAEGTTTTVKSGLPFSESHASPGKSISKLAAAAGAETRYRSDFTLDYLDRLGSDRTAETLSPSNGNIISEPRIREQVTEEVNNVRVLGAKSGAATITAEATASSFGPNTDRAVWREHSDKEIQQQDRAQAVADELVAEYDGEPEYLEVEIEIPRSVDPTLGDSFTVQLPDRGIDTELRIMELTRLIDEAGDRFKTLLSNRKQTRRSDADQSAQSVAEFESGNAGQYFADSHPEGYDAFGPDVDYQFDYDRVDDVIAERRAELRVESRAYRLRASDEGHKHGVSASAKPVGALDSVDEYDDQGVSTASEGNWTSVDSTSLATQRWPFLISVSVGRNQSETETLKNLAARVAVDTDGDGIAELTRRVFPITGSSAPMNDIRSEGGTLVLYRNLADDAAIGLQISAETESGNDPVLSWGWQISGIDPHDHDITSTESSTAGAIPGIVETNNTPNNVDITVGGKNVASGLSHPIDERIDVSGELSSGTTPIVASTDSLGEIRITVEYEALVNASQ